MRRSAATLSALTMVIALTTRFKSAVIHRQIFKYIILVRHQL